MSLFESAVCDNSPVEAWQVLPEETGSEGVYQGGLLAASSVYTRMCQGMFWGGTA